MVAISRSGKTDEIAPAVDVLAAGARAATTQDLVRHAEVIVLGVPMHRIRELPRDLYEVDRRSRSPIAALRYAERASA